MDTDRNLLFGVPAYQMDFIDAQQFAGGCSFWNARNNVRADYLISRTCLQ